MSGFLERIFNPPNPHKNQRKISSAFTAMHSTNRNLYEANNKIKWQGGVLRSLREQMEALQAQVVKLEEQAQTDGAELRRLTRCLTQNGIIDQADLQATLPEPDQHD